MQNAEAETVCLAIQNEEDACIDVITVLVTLNWKVRFYAAPYILNKM